MQQLNNEQQQALEAFHKTGELGILSNIFIEDCLKQKNTLDFRQRLNQMDILQYQDLDIFATILNLMEKNISWEEISNSKKVIIIQTLLSQTPDGKAIMSFLDVETEEILHNHYNHIIRLNEEGNEYVDEQPIYITLDHHLYKENAEALRTGKSFEKALEIITKIYITEIYV